MFGLGKILGGVIGGLLDKVGLGALTPFVKMGLDAMTGNWLGVAEDVFGMVSQFKNNPMEKAATRPPLGNFESSNNQFSSSQNKLNGNRMSGLMKSLSSLFSGFKALTSGDILGGFGKILNAFQTVNESFNNNNLFAQRSNLSQYSSLPV